MVRNVIVNATQCGNAAAMDGGGLMSADTELDEWVTRLDPFCVAGCCCATRPTGLG
jgi:hypothetical protein